MRFLFEYQIESCIILCNNIILQIFLPVPKPPVEIKSALTPFTVARDGRNRHLSRQNGYMSFSTIAKA